MAGFVAFSLRTPAWRLPLAAGTTLLVAGLAVLSWRQAATWRDTGTLALHAVRVSPRLTVPWTLLSGWQLDHGAAAGAVESATQAVSLAPQNEIAWLNLGAGLVRSGEFDAATTAFARAAALGTSRPEAAAIFHNRGHFHFVAGRFEEAVANFRIAADLDPASVASITNLAVALKKLGRTAEADAVRERLPHAPATTR
jgi:tetratricopeptide (TPR) repeat protein